MNLHAGMARAGMRTAVRARLMQFALWMVLPLLAAAAAHAATTEPLWAKGLGERLLEVQRRSGGVLGVYVHHLERDEAFSFQGHDPWYLASGVKVPVAIAVLRDIEAGELALSSTVRLLPTDFVDGAGRTNHHAAGSQLTVSFLLEQMILYSDNTATDVLIRKVGLDRVNAVANELFDTTSFVMTPLAEVRRMAYGMFDPRASELTSEQLLTLRRAEAGSARVLQLAGILGVAPEELLVPDMDTAFDAYYARLVNTASLAEYARMLQKLVEGDALGERGTQYLLDLTSRITTGRNRIQAALPAGSRFAHKTGTQHRRACDMGIVTTEVGDDDIDVIVVACIRDVDRQAHSERALREVGAALVESGVITLPARAGGAP